MRGPPWSGPRSPSDAACSRAPGGASAPRCGPSCTCCGRSVICATSEPPKPGRSISSIWLTVIGGGLGSPPRPGRDAASSTTTRGSGSSRSTSDDRPLAAEALAFVRTGEDPAGGVRWVEDAASRNTCSTASAAWLALELGDRAFAERAMDWLDATLRTDEGLYQDRLEEGRIDPTIWSYNQGAAVAALAPVGSLRRRDHHGDRVAAVVHGRSVVARAAAVPRDLVPRAPAAIRSQARKPRAGSSRTPTDSSPRRSIRRRVCSRPAASAPTTARRRSIRPRRSRCSRCARSPAPDPVSRGGPTA